MVIEPFSLVLSLSKDAGVALRCFDKLSMSEG